MAKEQWYCSAGGKVTVGLASHLPCVTDFAAFSPTSSMVSNRAMSSTPTLSLKYYTIYLYPVDIGLEGSVIVICCKVKAELSLCVCLFSCVSVSLFVVFRGERARHVGWS